MSKTKKAAKPHGGSWVNRTQLVNRYARNFHSMMESNVGPLYLIHVGYVSGSKDIMAVARNQETGQFLVLEWFDDGRMEATPLVAGEMEAPEPHILH